MRRSVLIGSAHRGAQEVQFPTAGDLTFESTSCGRGEFWLEAYIPPLPSQPNQAGPREGVGPTPLSPAFVDSSESTSDKYMASSTPQSRAPPVLMTLHKALSYWSPDANKSYTTCLSCLVLTTILKSGCYCHPIVAVGKCRPREIKQLAQGLPARKWQGWDSNLGPCEPWSRC